LLSELVALEVANKIRKALDRAAVAVDLQWVLLTLCRAKVCQPLLLAQAGLR
jgi:hypothetical protein